MDVCATGFIQKLQRDEARTAYEQSDVVSHVLLFFCYPDASNQLRAMKLWNEKVQDFREDVRTSGMKGYVVFNVMYSAVCTAKRIENWDHGKGGCPRARSECKRGTSSSLTPGSVVMVKVKRRETLINEIEQARCPCSPIKGLALIDMATDHTPSPSG